jgi:hypothetical protein
MKKHLNNSRTMLYKVAMSKATYIPVPAPGRPVMSGNRKGAGARTGNRNAERHGFHNREAQAHRARQRAIRAHLKLCLAWAKFFAAHLYRARGDRRRVAIIRRRMARIAVLLSHHREHLDSGGEGVREFRKTISLRRSGKSQRRRAV